MSRAVAENFRVSHLALCMVAPPGGAAMASVEVEPEIVNAPRSLFDLQAQLLGGETVELERYKGCVCLVVNVASA